MLHHVTVVVVNRIHSYGETVSSIFAAFAVIKKLPHPIKSVSAGNTLKNLLIKNTSFMVLHSVHPPLGYNRILTQK